MPTYLWSAKNSDGQAVLERVTAANAAEAKAQLTARGLTDLELKTEDIHDAVAQLVHNETGNQPQPTPQQQLRYMESKWAPVWDALWQSKGLLCLSAALL
ncbi:MAG: hypothetical protein HY301_07540, partial [Verrucomicrobia bacterium]|nr:hypothetical protein [Verrucomicrobiota bacterium]